MRGKRSGRAERAFSGALVLPLIGEPAEVSAPATGAASAIHRDVRRPSAYSRHQLRLRKSRQLPRPILVRRGRVCVPRDSSAPARIGQPRPRPISSCCERPGRRPAAARCAHFRSSHEKSRANSSSVGIGSQGPHFSAIARRTAPAYSPSVPGQFVHPLSFGWDRPE